jgi:hypothetical protein
MGFDSSLRNITKQNIRAICSMIMSLAISEKDNSIKDGEVTKVTYPNDLKEETSSYLSIIIQTSETNNVLFYWNNNIILI